MHGGDPGWREATSPSGRREIAEVECSALDTVLALTFEPRELTNLLAGAAAGCCERSALTAVHRAVHEDAGFARRLGRLLDLLHRDAIARLAEADPFDFASRPLPARNHARELAGRVWALSTSSDPSATKLARCMERRVILDGLERLRAEPRPEGNPE